MLKGNLNIQGINIFPADQISFFCLLAIALFVSCGEKKIPDNQQAILTEAAAGSTSSIEKQIENLSASIRTVPTADLYYQRAVLYINRKNFPFALTDINQALKLDSLKASYYLTLADIHLAMGRAKQTGEVLERSLIIDPENLEASMKLAELYLYKKEYAKSVKYINAILRKDIHNPKAYFLKGLNYKELNDTAKALSSFKTAVEQDPEYYNGYMELGVLYAGQKNPLALQYYTTALMLNPKSIEVYYARGMFYQEIGQYKKAIGDYFSILELDSGYKYAYYNLGYIHLVYLEEYKEAIRYFSNTIRCDSAYADAYYNRGLSYEELRDLEKARNDYRQVLTLDPSYQKAKQRIEKLQ